MEVEPHWPPGSAESQSAWISDGYFKLLSCVNVFKLQKLQGAFVSLATCFHQGFLLVILVHWYKILIFLFGISVLYSLVASVHIAKQVISRIFAESAKGLMSR